VQLFLAVVPPLWELASLGQLLRSKLFSKFVRVQARCLTLLDRATHSPA